MNKDQKKSGFKTIPDCKIGYYNSLGIDFHGRMLFIVRYNGLEYVAVKPIVKGMGLNWRGQQAKIRRSGRYAEILINMQTPGGPQKMLCIPLGNLESWLSSISIEKIRSGYKEIVRLYQKECFPALHNFMCNGTEPPKSPIQPAKAAADTGFVYIIENGNRKVKIGKSRKPLQRIRTAQTQGGFRAENIFISDRIADYENIETELHRRFREHRFIGEWFAIEFEEAVRAYHKVVN